MLKTLTDGLVGKGGDPEAFDGDTTACLLQYPALDEFALLPRIPAVDDQLSLRDEPLNDGELSLVVLYLDGLDTEAIGDHRE